jgi:outer membrane receptor protein involved in Fe transport
VGDYGRRTIDGGFGGPVSDTFGVRLTGVQYSEDGYYTNSITGNNVGGVDGFGGAITAVWRPADVVKVKARVEYSDDSYDPRAVVNIKGDTPKVLPPSALAIVRPPDLTGNPYIPQPGGSSATNLFNFGAYCPKFGFDPLSTPGDGSGAAFCLPGTVKNAGQQKVALSENPETGTDFPGTETQTFRASLIATFDLGYGLVSSYTGWTDFDGLDLYDQDYQASVAPDVNGNSGVPYTFNPDGSVAGGRIDTLLGAQESNQDTSTKQFSQEFRYETQLDGPVQFTGGVLFWQEHRQLADRNNITFCAPYGRVNADLLQDSNGDGVAPPGILDPATGDLQFVPGICDGTNNTLTSFQDYRRQVAYPQYASTWDARTRHLSFYGRLDWEMTEDLTLSLEDRFVDEEFNLSKPGSSSCTETAFATGSNPTAVWAREDRTLCDIERLVFNLGATQNLLDPATGNLTLRYIEGTTYSTYNTPKVTLAWSATDSTNYFFSFGFGQKPGGINQLTGGGGAEPPSIEDERFDSEKLKAWELGVKTSFEAAGFWNVNSSIFLNDYTDKQVGIQFLTESNVSQPRIVNIDGSRVWGFEFDAVWQPSFMEGLTLGLAGTLQDAEITDWTDDTRNLVRAAVYGDCPVVYKLADQSTPDPKDQLESSDPNDPIFQDATSNPGAKPPVAFCRLDYSGNELERAPKQSYSASAAIQRPFLDTPFEYLFEVSGSWQDERWLEPENNVQVADYARMDMRLGLTSDKWEVIAYVDNVLDDDRFLTAGSGPDFGEQVTQLGFTAGFGTTHYFATLPDPRVFGIRGSYRFGGGL